MKRRDLILLIEKAQFEFARHGANHDIYVRGEEVIEVPRHKEINEKLARAIIKKWKL